MIRWLGYLFSVSLVILGLYSMYTHEAWQEARRSTLTPHTGRIADDLTWHHRVNSDGSLDPKRYSSIEFYLDGEHWEYSMLVPTEMDSNTLKIKALRSIKKGDPIELQYIDLDWSRNKKRRVWAFARPDQPPIISAQDAIKHSDDKSRDLSMGLVGIGLGLFYFLTKTRVKRKAQT